MSPVPWCAYSFIWSQYLLLIRLRERARHSVLDRARLPARQRAVPVHPIGSCSGQSVSLLLIITERSARVTSPLCLLLLGASLRGSFSRVIAPCIHLISAPIWARSIQTSRHFHLPRSGRPIQRAPVLRVRRLPKSQKRRLLVRRVGQVCAVN